MIKNIAHGYGKLFSSAIKVLLLLVFCTLLGASIVYPLWNFATKAPQVYTVSILVLIGAILIFLLVKKILKSGAKSVFLHLLRIAIIAAGICGAVVLVLYEMRLLAVPALILTFVLYGVLSFGYAKK